MIDVRSDNVRSVFISKLTIQNGAGGSAGGVGGIHNQNSSVVLEAVVVRNNQGLTGGIFNGGTLELRATTISENRGTNAGGGVWNAGTLSMDDGTISGNSARDWGGGILQSGHGPMQIRRTTIDGNHVDGYGGGIAITGLGPASDVGLHNTTISGNTAANDGGGIWVTALVFAGDGTLTANNVTLTLNVADVNNLGIGDGGASRDTTGALAPCRCPQSRSATASVGGNADRSGEAADCSTTYGTQDSPIIARGYNLIGSLAGCTLDPSSNLTGNIIALPDLGPLDSNGGETRTHRPNSTSPVRNAGNSAVSPGSGPYACELTDQRNLGRSQGPACDIGAVEVREPAVCGDDLVDGSEVCDGECCTSDCLTILEPQPDTDGDGVSCDNCPTFNPDQRDSDADCIGTNHTSCGDVCDPCPMDATTTCDQTGSGGATIGAAGGVLEGGRSR